MHSMAVQALKDSGNSARLVSSGDYIFLMVAFLSLRIKLKSYLIFLFSFCIFKAIKRRKSVPAMGTPREGSKVPQTVTLIREQQNKGIK